MCTNSVKLWEIILAYKSKLQYLYSNYSENLVKPHKFENKTKRRKCKTQCIFDIFDTLNNTSSDSESRTDKKPH